MPGFQLIEIHMENMGIRKYEREREVEWLRKERTQNKKEIIEGVGTGPGPGDPTFLPDSPPWFTVQVGLWLRWLSVADALTQGPGDLMYPRGPETDVLLAHWCSGR